MIFGQVITGILALSPFFLSPPCAFAAPPAESLQGRPVPLRGINSIGVVLQQFDYSCAAASLATILLYGFNDLRASERLVLDTALEELPTLDREQRRKSGLTVLDIEGAAKRLGYLAKSVWMPANSIDRLTRPVIVFMRLEEQPHFAVLKGVRGGNVYLADPSLGNITIPLNRFLEFWAGTKHEGIVIAIEGIDRGWLRRSTLLLDVDPLVESKARPQHISVMGMALQNRASVLDKGEILYEMSSAYSRIRGMSASELASGSHVFGLLLGARVGLGNGLEIAASLPGKITRIKSISRTGNEYEDTTERSLNGLAVEAAVAIAEESEYLPSLIVYGHGLIPASDSRAIVGAGFTLSKYVSGFVAYINIDVSRFATKATAVQWYSNSVTLGAYIPLGASSILRVSITQESSTKTQVESLPGNRSRVAHMDFGVGFRLSKDWTVEPSAGVGSDRSKSVGLSFGRAF